MEWVNSELQLSHLRTHLGINADDIRQVIF